MGIHYKNLKKGDIRDLEFNWVWFWSFFDKTLGLWMANHIEKETFELLNSSIFDEQEKVDFKDPQKRAEMLKKIRVNFAQTKYTSIFHQKFWFLNRFSPLMQHFCENIARGVALDDVYNGRGDFRGCVNLILPEFAPKDFLYNFYANCPNGQSVRNRYVIVRDLIAKDSHAKNILSIASGSAQAVIDGVYRNSTIERVVLSDESKDALAVARKRAEEFCISHKAQIIQCPITEMYGRLSEEKFGIVEACGILDYFPDVMVVRFVRNALRRLKDGGKLIISNMAETSGADWLRRVYNWEIAYRNPGKMVDLIKRAGGGSIEVLIEPWKMHPVFVIS